MLYSVKVALGQMLGTWLGRKGEKEGSPHLASDKCLLLPVRVRLMTQSVTHNLHTSLAKA